MKIKVLSFLEGMDINQFPDTEMVKVLSKDSRFDVEVKEITPGFTTCEQPWSNSLRSMDIGMHNIVTKKDLVLLDRLEEYKHYMDKYDGVLVLDFNKEIKDIEWFCGVLQEALDNDMIVTTKPELNHDINDEKYILYKSKKNKRILYNLLFVPNSRYDEFIAWKFNQIRGGAYHVIKAYEDPNYNPIALCQINYKWRFSDKTENDEQKYNRAIYHKMARELAISYGILEQDSYHRMLPDELNKSFENVLFIWWNKEYCLDENGNTCAIEGNPMIRSGRSNMGKPKDIWNLEKSNENKLSKLPYESEYRKMNREFEKLPTFKDDYERLTKVFIDYLKADYPDWEEIIYK